MRITSSTALHEQEAVAVWEDRWQLGSLTGRAWRVRFPRTAYVDVVAAEGLQRVSELTPPTDGPWAVINGGFYEWTSTGQPLAMGLVVADGAELTALSARGGSGVFFSDEAGHQIVHREAWKTGPKNALQSIDRLVDQRASVVKHRPGAPLAARSAVVIGDNDIWLVALAAEESISGDPPVLTLRSTSGRGLPLWAFADYLLLTTAPQTALNLDGAISTQLLIHTGDFRLDVIGERGTINAIRIAQPTQVEQPAVDP